MDFVNIKESDVVFNLDIASLRNYKVAFFIEDDRGLNRNAFNDAFVKIMKQFGLLDVRFDFIYSNESCNREKIGILWLT